MFHTINILVEGGALVAGVVRVGLLVLLLVLVQLLPLRERPTTVATLEVAFLNISKIDKLEKNKQIKQANSYIFSAKKGL